MGRKPEQLGPYAVESEIGRGGMGVVYLARDPRLERKVAIKVLTEAVAEDPQRLERFVREARTLASLNHPNVAIVYGLEDHLGSKMLVMEYVPGVHLGTRLRKGPPMPMAEVFDIAAQIARGLEAAHAMGVVHRDVKPANVRIRTDDGVVKVLDFGLAKAEPVTTDLDPDEQTLPVDITEPGRVVGTAGYMSPEQARAKPVDKRTDIWSFGCMLFECLAGQRAFPGDTPMDAIAAILERDPRWEAMPAETPREIVALVRQCLEKDATRRLDNIGDARLTLEDAMAPALSVADKPSVHRHPTGGEPSLPPSPMPPGRPGIPSPGTSFVGRSAELAEIERLVGSNRIVTMTGTGGCGKTRLAIVAAERAQGLFDLGCRWVDVTDAADANQLVRLVAAAVGAPSTDAREPATAIAETVEDRSMLLILDGCEEAPSNTGAAIAELLALCSGMCVLTTSREPLGAEGEIVYHVPTLTPPSLDGEPTAEAIAENDAVALFVDRARQVRPGFQLTDENAPVVAKICRALDGIPLAVELAASRAKVLTPAQIAERLVDRFGLLRRRGDGQTLEAAIGWSYEQLGDDERAFFRRICVCRGGVPLAAAEALCPGGAIPESPEQPAHDIGPRPIGCGETLDLLESLVDRSLIYVDESPRSDSGPVAEPRYNILETIRWYGVKKLEETGESAPARADHLAWAAALAREARRGLLGPRERSWLARLGEEDANLRAAIRWSTADGDIELGRQIGGAIWRFWILRGHIEEGRTLLAELDRASAGGAPTASWARVREGIAWIAMTVGDLPTAVAFGRGALEIARAVGEQRTVAGALNCLGAACQGDCLDERAMDLLEEALTIERLSEGPEDAAARADTMGRIGDCLRGLGRADEAVERITRCLSALQPIKGTSILAQTQTRLGWARLAQGNLDAAETAMAEGLGIKLELEAPGEYPESIELAACIASRRGDARRAARLFEAAESIRSRLACPARPSITRDTHADRQAAIDALPKDVLAEAQAEGRTMKPRRAARYAQEMTADAARGG